MLLPLTRASLCTRGTQGYIITDPLLTKWVCEERETLTAARSLVGVTINLTHL
jgi:hypothetical protein